MSWISRVANVFRSSGVDRALDDEIRFHIESRIDELVAAGMSREDAEMTARRQFGNQLRVRELSRDIKLMPSGEELVRDVRHGVRALRRSPILASVVILTLALGIGVNAAIVSIVNGVLLRPLAYPNPTQLMFLSTQFPALGFPQFWASVPEYLEFRQFTRSFDEVGAFRNGEANLLAGERAFRVRSAIVDAHLLNALGVRPALGRLFRSEDSIVTAPPLPGGSAAAQPVVLISYELWQSVFGGQPIVSERVEVDGRRLEVVGVMARRTDLMDRQPEIWLPLGFTDDERRARNNHNLFLIGRLKESATPASAQTELDVLTETWSARTGVTPGGGHGGHVFLAPGKGDGHILRMTPLADQILGRAGRSIWVLQAAVGFVLLIACANVANLLLARAETRRREFAMLTALGASRGRLVRKTLIESVILSLAGGAVGVLLARAGIETLVHAFPASLPRMSEVAVDQRVVLVSLAIALACGALFGLLPLTHGRSDTLANTLKSGSPGSSGTTRHRLRRGLVVTQTALAVIVVVGAGLLLRTVHNLTAADPGFDRSRLVTFSVTLPPASFNLIGRVRAYQTLLEQLRAAPGLHAASAMTSLPLDRQFISNQTEITQSTTAPEPLPTVDYQRVMSGFFDVMGIPILRGRGFQSSDAASSGYVTVVNEALANTYWNGRNPIGQRLRPAGNGPWFTVVGVAKDVKQMSVDQPVGAEAYVLVDQLATDSPTTWLAFSPTTMHVVVRTTLPLETLAAMIARVVRLVDPALPVERLRMMDEVFTQSIRRPRLLAQLLTLFSALALLLAAIGTYGVLAFVVTERRREIGIRLALGAEQGRLLRQVMTQGFTPVAIGIAAGLAGALGVSRFLRSLLYGVEPVDAMTLAIAIATVAGMGAFACWLPAWRASRLDPSVALRVE
jgi:putative ABC transport system permease protein